MTGDDGLGEDACLRPAVRHGSVCEDKQILIVGIETDILEGESVTSL